MTIETINPGPSLAEEEARLGRPLTFHEYVAYQRRKNLLRAIDAARVRIRIGGLPKKAKPTAAPDDAEQHELAL